MVVKGWVHDASLKAFLESLSLLTGCAFDGDDWLAIAHGIVGTSTDRDSWFAYDLGGAPDVPLKLGYDGPGSGVVFYEVRVEDAVAPKVAAAEAVINHFHVTS